MNSGAMVVSVGKIGVAHTDYYTDYYRAAGEKPPRWLASGAMNVAAGTVVSRDDLRAALSCKDPDTGEQLGRKYTAGVEYTDPNGVRRFRKSMSAYDMTYSVPKSISVAWALSDDRTRSEIEAAYDASTVAVADYLQKHAVASRADAGGSRRVAVPDGATVVRADHRTSRAGDPQLHSHLLFMNRVLCEDGVWRTLDGRLLYSHAMPASLYGAAVLRTELSQRLGWSWDRVGGNLHAEIAGNDDRLSRMWSQRSREVTRAAQRRVREFEANRKREPTILERLAIWDKAAVETRTAKDVDAVGDDPHGRWLDEAATLGIDASELLGSYSSAERVAPDTYDRPEIIIDGHQVLVTDTALDHLVATAENMGSSLSDADLDKAVFSTITADGGLASVEPSSDPTAMVDQLAAALRTRLESHLVRHEDRWYSPGLTAAETASAAWLASPASDPEAGQARLDRIDTEGLGPDQAQAAGELLAAPSTAAVVIGPAGAGKTTMLARVAAAAGAHNVVAAAPTAVAAGTLGAALGVRSDTVARLLVSEDNPIPEHGIVIIDEATQLGTRDLAGVCGLAARADARVVLVGDPAQQGSIASGGMFAALAEARTVTTVALTELWRFDDHDEAAATVRLRAGDRNALDYHQDRGRISEASHGEVAEAAADWWQDRQDHSTALSAPTTDLVSEINAEIAARRHAAGETQQAVLGDGPDTIRVGDVATTRRNNRRIVASDGEWVRNGDRWNVVGASPAGGVLLRRTDTDATVLVPAHYAQDWLQLGYAVTQTRSQSVTVDSALTVVTAASRLSELYVGLTRGRQENHLLVVTDQLATDEDIPPDQSPADTVLKAVFERRGHQAVATDPAVNGQARAAAGSHLAQVAATAHTQPLPVPDGFNAVEVLQHADQAVLRRRSEDLEASVEAEIEAWVRHLELDEQQDQQTASEVLEALEELRSLDEITANAPHDYPGHSADDYPDHTYDDYPDHTYDDSDVGPFNPREDLAAVEDLVAGVPVLTQPPPVPVPSLVDRNGPTHLAYQALGLGDAPSVLRDVLDRLPAHLQQRRVATDDNAALVNLVAAYQRSEHAGNVGTSAKLAALVAAVADAPLRRELETSLAVGASPEALDAGDLEWARSVRRDVLHRRAALWAPVLDQLDARREALRRTAADAVDTADLPWAVTGDSIVAHDRALWRARCLLWLDADASVRGLADIWYDTNSSLRNVAVGVAEPCLSRLGDDMGDPPWRTLAEAAPPVPGPAPLDATPADTYTYPVDTPPTGEDPARRLRAATEAAADWYHHQLLYSRDPQAAEARHYLQGRGVGPDDWKQWRLGWAPNQWRNVTNHLKDDQAALDAGIAAHSKTGRVYDTMRGRVIMPICDTEGDVVAFAGRALHEGDDTPKYLNTRTTSLWSKSSTLYGLHQAAPSIAETGSASLVEGYLDVIAAHRSGLTNAVASCGTAVTQAHIDALEDVGADQVYLALDGDAAGRAAARAARRITRDSGLPTRTVNLPQGEDPASLDPAELHRLWNAAEPQPWAEISTQLHDHDPHNETVERLVRASRAIQDETNGCDPLTRLVAAHQAAAACGFPFHLVLDDSDLPRQRQPSIDNSDAQAQAAGRTYGLAHDAATTDIDDIAITIAALHGEPAASPELQRQPARTR